jgi:hypothetical protein
VEEIARHDGSAAWCALNCSIAGVLQSFLAQEGTREIGSALDLVVNGIIAPSGRALEVEAGTGLPAGGASQAAATTVIGWLQHAPSSRETRCRSGRRVPRSW